MVGLWGVGEFEGRRRSAQGPQGLEKCEWGGGVISKSSLMTFDGWFVEKGKSSPLVRVSLPHKQRTLQHSERPPSPNASDRKGG